jgi:hypothetical protein
VRTISPAPGKTLAEITIQERSPVLLSDDFLMIFICVRRSLARASRPTLICRFCSFAHNSAP